MTNEQKPSSDARPRSAKKDWGIYVLVCALVIGLWALNWWYVDTYVLTSNVAVQTSEASRGQFGDKFGAINSLFSGLAFAGIIFTIYLQRRELSLQRQDIEAQNDTLRQQRFENSFFHLLALHSDIVDKLGITSHDKREAFAFFIELLKQTNEMIAFQPLSRLHPQQIHELRATLALTDPMRIRLTTGEISTLTEVLLSSPGTVGQYLDTQQAFHLDLISAAYVAAHHKAKNGLSHYFRNLYHVYRFLDESVLVNDSEKQKYARIIRAQLSDDELVCILYNALARSPASAGMEFGFPKMTRLIRKYDILQNLLSRPINSA